MNSGKIDARDINYPHKELPVMDLAPIMNGDREAIRELAGKWKEAAETLGFMCLVNHGIPQEKIEKMEEQIIKFHDKDVDFKMDIKVNENQRGYIPSKATILTHSKYEEHTKTDSVECLVLATEYPDDHPNVKAGKQFYGKNQWPEMDNFKEDVMDYWDGIINMCKKLLPVWAEALDVEDNFFEPHFEELYSYFRLAKYPKVEFVEEKEFGLGAHADTGFMTILPLAKEPGLQVMDTDGSWFWPIIPDGALILNLGQFLERWTNEKFRATPHRVLPPRNNDRYSLACFVNTSLETVAKQIPSCVSSENPMKYPEESYWDFYKWYIQQTYTHYGKVEEKTA
ncbi:MAG: isopenicillin N synthase family oxygenase [Rhizobiales bacterium]|nr:isopenicillin N synthase family oxygenase [Hyphomicrobiales bacterium]